MTWIWNVQRIKSDNLREIENEISQFWEPWFHAKPPKIGWPTGGLVVINWLDSMLCTGINSMPESAINISDIRYLNWIIHKHMLDSHDCCMKISRMNLDTDHDQSSPVRKAKCWMSRSQHPIPHEVFWIWDLWHLFGMSKYGWFCGSQTSMSSANKPTTRYFLIRNIWIFPMEDSLSIKTNNWWCFRPSWNIFLRLYRSSPLGFQNI